MYKDVFGALGFVNVDNLDFEYISDEIISKAGDTERGIIFDDRIVYRYILDDDIEYWYMETQSGEYTEASRGEIICINEWQDVESIKKLPSALPDECIADSTLR